MRFIKTVFLFIAIPLISFAEGDANSIWVKANTLFENNSYDSASVYYKQLSNEYQSIAAYYNLGNTYYKLNLPIQLLTGISIIWLLFFTFSYYAKNNKYNGKEAIVMDNNAAFKLQPDVSKTSSLIPEGTKVTILHKRSSWAEIILPDGRKGWMNTEVLTNI